LGRDLDTLACSVKCQHCQDLRLPSAKVIEWKRHKWTVRRLGLIREASHESCIVETDRSSI
jgi:hypothetical protein